MQNEDAVIEPLPPIWKVDHSGRVRKDLYFQPDEMDAIWRAKGADAKIGTFMQNTIKARVDEVLRKPTKAYAPVRVLGYIPAGPALEVCPMPDYTTATPPFSIGADCYVLLVTGDSMEAQVGPSIPSGSYAVFCADAVPFYGTFVHAEWEDSPGVRLCTIKRYESQPDGSVVFAPLNKAHKPITRKPDTFVIRGVFARSWKETNEEDA